MTVFVEPIRSREERLRWWRRRLQATRFDPERQFIGPELAERAPGLALRVRLNVLLRTYHGHYFGDAFDVDRLRCRIQAGQEGMIFWGPYESVRRVRAWAESGVEPDDWTLDELELGTATFVAADDEFGRGHVEHCRGASVCRSPSAAGPAIWSYANWLSGSRMRRAHTVVLVIRAGSGGGPLPGGAAIHRLSVREIRSSFWGAVPWHVTDPGCLEMHDYRELYRKPEAVIADLAARRVVAVADQRQADFVRAVLRANLGPPVQSGIEVVIAEQGARDPSRWHAHYPGGRAQLGGTHVVLVPSASGLFASLDDACSDEAVSSAACVVARVPMDHDDGASTARLLADRGFSLAVLIPPKGADRGEGSPRFQALWARPRSDLDVAPPYYLGSSRLDPAERPIARYLTQLCAEWREPSGRRRLVTMG
jgi:hypothetical protein